MIDFVQYVINGLLLGGVYALIASVFIFIYRSSRVVNFAQGEMVMFAAFISWSFMVQMGLPWWMSILLSMGVGAALGLIIERLALRPLIGQALFSVVMVTIALMLMIRGMTLLIWGSDLRIYPYVLPKGVFHVGPFIFNISLFWGLLVTVVVVFLFWWLFNRTRLGLALSAVAEDHQVARAMGISVTRSIAMSWAISGIVCVVVAVFWLSGQSMTSSSVAGIGLRALPCVLLAGMESVLGALLAGIILGIGESIAGGYLDPITGGGISVVFPYVLMILITFFRPYGLFGWKNIERL